MAANILIIEDDLFLIAAYQAKLPLAGYKLRVATDGSEALAAIKEFTPDVILLDLLMPRMDGFTFLETLHAQNELKTVPIVVTTNLSDKRYRERAELLGVKDFIIKSDTSLDDLVSKIQEVLQRYAVQAN
ncbi:MAG TPA: response regulator [Candidatus Saccharimonadales bacterium]|nr:response regulator [Candidatus Saccharimonadales bacterium]